LNSLHGFFYRHCFSSLLHICPLLLQKTWASRLLIHIMLSEKKFNMGVLKMTNTRQKCCQ
jgi:hypothetical protein